jgi:hypothetical protein
MVRGEGEQGVTAAGKPERLLVSTVALGAVAALFVFRSFDDNRLTSWAWVFAETHPARLFGLVLAAVVVAQLAANVPLPRKRPGAVLFLASYAVAAAFWVEPEVIVDASRYFTQAKHLEVYGVRHFLAEWGRGILAWTDLPLVPFLYGLVFEVFGESRIHAQAFTTLLFAGSVVLTHRIGKTLWDEDVGFMAGALLLAIPYLLTQVPSLLVDVPTMFFFTLAIFAVVHAVQRGGGAGRIAFASAAVFLAVFSKYSTWLMLSVLPVSVWIVRRGGAPRALRTGAAIALASGVLVAAVMAWFRDAFSQQISLLVGYQAPGLRRWGESFASTFLFQVHPFLTVAAVVSAWLALRRRDGRWVIVAFPVLLLLVLRIQRIRYSIPVFPMVALMGAYGLQAIRTSEMRRLVVACAVFSSLVVGLYGYLPFLRSISLVNLKTAGRYLDSIDEKHVEVFTVSRSESEVNPAVAVPILDLFTAKKVIYSYETPSPSQMEKVKTSALRFTWELRDPGYYAPGDDEGGAAVAVISDDVGGPLPEHVAHRLEGYRLARSFRAYEGVFPYRTMVRVYRTEPPSR